MPYQELANCIRFLAIDAVEKANSGHPGMPMGMADVATVLFADVLKFYPNQPKWPNRDRFVLSAGHGSILLYSLLYLTGYPDINLSDLQNFRQLHSKCAGHPEFGELLGIETTTGPLGQGVANAVGMAIAQKILQQKFSAELPEFSDLFQHKIYALVGDGCLMEGVALEALSLAGHLGLNNLVVLWDNNSISIDGKTTLTVSENIHLKMQAMGFLTHSANGHDFNEIKQAFAKTSASTLPVFLDFKTIIGYGSNQKAGTQKAHGSPLGAVEVAHARKNLNWQFEPFEIPANLLQPWQEIGQKHQQTYLKWQEKYNQLPEKIKQEIDFLLHKKFPCDFWQKFTNYQQQTKQNELQATRKSSWQVLEFLTANLPNLLAGSADLTESVLTKTSSSKSIKPTDFSGNYLHYGVREHAMAAIMNGLALHSNFIPYAGTFLVFADYCKPAMRLSALMKQQVFYILTHDSIGLGEDGPTHQPIEQLAMLRAIPNLLVFRPCDLAETIASYELALKATKSPSAFILSRQNLPALVKINQNYQQGAYVIAENLQKFQEKQVLIFASGSEVQIAMAVFEALKQQNIACKVVSVLCFELFKQQNKQYQQEILLSNQQQIIRVAIEAGSSFGWHQFIGIDGIFVGIDSFGASAQASDLFLHFNITANYTLEQILAKL